MGAYFRRSMAWLGVGFAAGILLLVVLSAWQLNAQEYHGDHLGDAVLYVGLPWILFGFTMGLVGRWLDDSRLYQPVVSWVCTILNGLLLLVILVAITRIVFGFIPGFESLQDGIDGVMSPIWAAGRDLAGHVRAPARVAGMGTGPIVVIALMLLARNGVTWAQGALMPGEERAASLGEKPEVRSRTRDTRRARSVARKVAVSSYSEAMAVLEASQMELTFLAMDIVGSTSMKRGEDPYIIEQAFSDYRKLVERMLGRHGAYKQTWTPDGQMAAFRSSQSAVDCGRDILLALPEFNRNISRMSTPFRLRVGANTGTVSTDDMTPMEEMSDHEIDVAGHMQKYADPDSIWISEATYEKLSNRSGFELIDREVDERQVYAWERPS